jgi:hypothetical protein
MKTFREFIIEARSKEDAEKLRQTKDNPDEWRVRNKGGGHHGLNTVSALKGQGKRRSENLKPLTTKELEDHAKRNLHPTPTKTAKRAIKIEGGRKRSQRDDARSKTNQTGQKHDVDHIQAQPNRRSETTKSRFQSIHPGDSSDNRRVIPSSENREKNSKNTEKTTLTRAGAIRRALQRAREN